MVNVLRRFLPAVAIVLFGALIVLGVLLWFAEREKVAFLGTAATLLLVGGLVVLFLVTLAAWFAVARAPEPPRRHVSGQAQLYVAAPRRQVADVDEMMTREIGPITSEQPRYRPEEHRFGRRGRSS